MKHKINNVIKYVLACVLVWGGFGFPMPHTFMQGCGIVLSVAVIVYVRYRNADDTEISAEFTELMRQTKLDIENGDATLFDLVKEMNWRGKC